ncbi:MAG: 5-formyltetrahydrofolate cyclo-ligase [Lachnospiraceae bacterium]|nr:5-formyltetrahydrofolate cyclo-ligase [Lachnospiraceae bacterium]
MTKSEYRKRMIKRRDALGTEERAEKDSRIRSRLFSDERWKQAEFVLLYLSCRSEADTREILREALRCGKRVFAPRITDPDKRLMDFYQVTGEEELKPGFRGIPEPAGEVCYTHRMDKTGEKTLMLLPGVAFSTRGDRIGYGGGYYDRYLARVDLMNRVALCYDCQVTDPSGEDGFPAEPTDIRPDCIITESGMIVNDKALINDHGDQ